MYKKSIAIILSAIMLLGCLPFAFAAEESASGYTITNPYQNINWETVNQYKAALHTHTNASDGDDTLINSIERHYETGFDIVAITDHGITDKSWTDSSKNSKLVTTFMSLIGKTDGELVFLEEKGTLPKGMSYEMKTVNGDDYFVAADGREILRIPFGIENNALSV